MFIGKIRRALGLRALLAIACAATITATIACAAAVLGQELFQPKAMPWAMLPRTVQEPSSARTDHRAFTPRQLRGFQADMTRTMRWGWGGGVEVTGSHPGTYDGCHLQNEQQVTSH